MSNETPLRPTQRKILSGLDTASHYLTRLLLRFHTAHDGKKYSPAVLSKLLQLDAQVQEMVDIRRNIRLTHNTTQSQPQYQGNQRQCAQYQGNQRQCAQYQGNQRQCAQYQGGLPNDFGTRILCVLADLKAMKDYMDEVDKLERGWVWVDDAQKIPMGEVNGVEGVEEGEEGKEVERNGEVDEGDDVREAEKVKEVEVKAGQKVDAVDETGSVGKTDAVEGKAGQKPDAVDETGSVKKTNVMKSNAEVKDQDPVIGGKCVLINKDGEEEESGSIDGRKSTNSDFVLVGSDGEDGGMEAANGTSNSEQGLLTTLQKYLKALKIR